MKLYTALDVSLRSVAICVVNEHGEVQYEAKVEADVQRIVTCLLVQCDAHRRGGYAGSARNAARRSALETRDMLRRSQTAFAARQTGVW